MSDFVIPEDDFEYTPPPKSPRVYYDDRTGEIIAFAMRPSDAFPHCSVLSVEESMVDALMSGDMDVADVIVGYEIDRIGRRLVICKDEVQIMRQHSEPTFIGVSEPNFRSIKLIFQCPLSDEETLRVMLVRPTNVKVWFQEEELTIFCVDRDSNHLATTTILTEDLINHHYVDTGVGFSILRDHLSEIQIMMPPMFPVTRVIEVFERTGLSLPIPSCETRDIIEVDWLDEPPREPCLLLEIDRKNGTATCRLFRGAGVRYERTVHDVIFACCAVGSPDHLIARLRFDFKELTVERRVTIDLPDSLKHGDFDVYSPLYFKTMRARDVTKYVDV